MSSAPVARVGTSRRPVVEVPLGLLNPLHPVPRPGVPQTHIPSLANLIRQNGYDIGRAIPVAQMPGRRLVALGGHHRVAAMRLLGEATIPACIEDWNALPGGVQSWWRRNFPQFPWEDFIP